MSKIQYLILLRGINVGGNNIIKMTDLQSCFENMGFSEVTTFIQSGNVLFKSDEKNITRLYDIIEKKLSEKFDYKSRMVILPQQQLERVVKEAPYGFGEEPDKYRYDVLFLKEPLTPDEILKNINPKEGVDKAYKGDSVLYFSKLISEAGKSKLTRIITLPQYQNITVRNWNTTTKLLALMEYEKQLKHP